MANPLVFAALERWHERQEALLPPDARPRDPAAGPDFPDRGHTILVGYGRVGAQLALLLRQRGVPVVVIDSDGDLVHRAHADGFPALRGNAASMDRMEELSPATATHALVAIPQAIEAGEIVAHLRQANPTMVILARAHSEATLRHLIEQGADGAVLAEVELAYSMAEMVMGARGTATTSPALPVMPS